MVASPLDLGGESTDSGAMTKDNLVATLERLSLFAGLKPQQLAEIVHRAERRRFWPGDLLTKLGQPSDGAYLLVSGPAQRAAGPRLMDMPEYIATGSLISEMAMLVEHDYGSTIVARDRVFCLKILRSALHAQMREDVLLAEHFHDRVTEQLQRTAEELRRIDKDFAASATAGVQPAPARFVAATYGRH